MAATALRVGIEHWQDDRLKHLFETLRETESGFEELSFFTSGCHAPEPVSTMRRRAKRLEGVLQAARSHGYTAGINVLSTLGHHEEGLEDALTIRAENQGMAPDGSRCRGSFCPRSDALVEYVRAVYPPLIEASPDFVWVDDDVRLAGHMPVSHTCFCPRCIGAFEAEFDFDGDRKDLLDAVGTTANPATVAVRKQWLEFNRQTIGTVLSHIEAVVHRQQPGLELGFMTGDRFYEGYAFDRWAAQLRGSESAPVRWRPGGGFYSDETPAEMVGKAHAIGRQVAALPDDVTEIQSEVENFPYQPLRKSVRAMGSESVAYMAAGATGTAFNLFGDVPDLDEYRRYLERIRDLRPFYEQLQEAVTATPPVGVWPAWSTDVFAAADAETGWPTSRVPRRASEVVAELGIPICYDRTQAHVVVLSGQTPWAFETDELETMLTRGVLMDAEALQILGQRGVDEGLLGVRVDGAFERDTVEVFADHHLNRRHSGWRRDVRQSFPWGDTAFTLEPVADSTEVVTELVDYRDRALGPAMTAFENDADGRVVVTGYAPWTMVHSSSKSTQLKAVCRWLSRGQLPAIVNDIARVVTWARRPTERTVALVVLNAALDPVDELELALPVPEQDFHVYQTGDASERVSGTFGGDGATRITLPSLGAWDCCLVRSA